MKRTPIKRKTPLVPGTLRGITNADLPTGVTLRKPRATTIKASGKRKPRNKATKAYMVRVAALGCIACRLSGYSGTLPELHHPRTNAGAGQKSSDMDVIPLCPAHHRGTMHPKVPSIHLDRLKFIAEFGTEGDLLTIVRHELALEDNA